MRIVKNKFQKFVMKSDRNFLPISEAELKSLKVSLVVPFLPKLTYCHQGNTDLRVDQTELGATRIREEVIRRKRRLRTRKMKGFHVYVDHAKS